MRCLPELRLKHGWVMDQDYFFMQMTESCWLSHSPAPRTWLVAHGWVHEGGSCPKHPSMAEHNTEFSGNSGAHSAEILLPWWLPLTWGPNNTRILTHRGAASQELAARITPITEPHSSASCKGGLAPNVVVWGSWCREADGESRQLQVGIWLEVD